MDLLLTVLSIKRIFYLVLITSVSFIIYHFQHHSEHAWVIWSALFLSLTVSEGSLLHRMKVIILTGLAIILAVVLSGLLSSISWLLAIELSLLTFGCVLFSLRRPQYFSSAFQVNILGILAGLSMPSFSQDLQRIIYIGMGVFIVCLFQLIFYFGLIKNEFQFNMKVSLQRLQLLSKEIFSSLIYPEYAKNIYLFERRIHIQKTKFMQSFNRLQQIILDVERVKNKESIKINHLIIKLNLFYDILLDCALLRFRVKDNAIFKVCAIEFIEVSRAIDKAMIDLVDVFSIRNPKQSLNIMQFMQSIQKLEENYQNVLQVAANDPLAFYLFIFSLKSLLEEMEVFYKMAIEIKW